jgi:DNA-binding transcriptional LysR family regulator
MEIQQLRHLIAAVHWGNLVRAAEECNISQSGLSRSIKSLEDRLGVQLLNRMAKGVEPTIYGRVFVRRAHLIVNEVGRSVGEIRALSAAETGEVTFGITQNYGKYFIPDLLSGLYASNPGMRVTVVTGGFRDLVEMLAVGSIEFGFGLLGSVGAESDIYVEPLREHYSRVIARRAHPLALRNQEVTPEELSQAHWALLSGEFFQKNFSDYFTGQGLKSPVQVLRTDSIDLIYKSLFGADVLSVLPPDLVGEELEKGILTILNCDAPAEQTHAGLIFRNRSMVSPQGEKIVAEIRRQLSSGATPTRRSDAPKLLRRTA